MPMGYSHRREEGYEVKERKSVPRGRRPLPADLRRSEFVGVRVTPASRRVIERAAKLWGQSLAEFVRESALREAVRIIGRKKA